MKEFELEVLPGDYFTEVHKKLKRKSLDGNMYYAIFNGNKITSSMSEDTMYLTIVGMNKNSYDKAEAERKRKIEEEELAFKERLPKVIDGYIAKGQNVLEPQYLPLWNKIVPIRLDDLYKGMELDCWLDLIEVLNDKRLTVDERFIVAFAVFNNQGHSGMSASLVKRGLRVLCSLGNEFVEYIESQER
jgi:hypothetical protein